MGESKVQCRSLYSLLLSIIVGLEIVSAFLAFYTLGEVFRTLYFAAIALNVIFIALALRYPNAAVVGIFILALLIIPYQFWLTVRLWHLQNEAAAIVTYAYEEKLASGEYPVSLIDYNFHNEALAPYFRYRTDSPECAFYVDYYVGSPTTSHSYCASQGWSYYPD
ncbi:hypothetical protein [Caldilinea sp.]|uniref:hypothetical protein n=1 Tax=Caldilinea sp. TaxID=2293560 RepID=UPI002CF199C3|nr:hypothetical protein [Anaerolineales bacterium]HQY92455.1 hypothetical protein [Caldilinea sp.]HRA64819.1 hypothetical protein [Caldilinea sp.]